MDKKDLIETLTSIGFFAITVAIGLLSERRKGRKNATAAPGPRKAPFHAKETHNANAAVSDGQGSKKTFQKKTPAKNYSFTPEEEGGCSLEGNHIANVEAENATQAMNEEQRREILRTLIVGEVLATPKFKN